MFDDLIKKAKGLLPEKFRGEDDDDEYEEDESEVTEVIDGSESTSTEINAADRTAEVDISALHEQTQEVSANNKTTVSSLDDEDEDEDDDDPKAEDEEEEDEDEDDEDEEEDEEEAEKKAKRSKMIKVVAGIAVVLIGADEILNPPEPEEDPAAQQKVVKKKTKKKNRKKKKVPKEAPPAEVAQNDPIEPVVKNDPPPKPEPTPKKIEAGPPKVVEPVVAAKPTPVATPKPQPIEPKPVDMGMIGEKKVTKSPANIGQIEEAKDGGLESVMKKIKPKKIEYVKPPNYEELGRGLVYNCKGRHWACVNKDSYFKCRSNFKWAKHNKKKKQCATVNVYGSVEDCETIQIHNINTNAKSEFCK